MSRLLDANILLRILQRDVKHPGYSLCVDELKTGGIVRPYVLPEIAYNFLGARRMTYAIGIARQRNELAEYQQAPKDYTRKAEFPASWKQQAYRELAEGLDNITRKYPGVQYCSEFSYNADLFNTTIVLAIKTGCDWVDCTLIAEEHVFGHTAISLDRDLIKIRKALPPSRSRRPGVKDLELH